MNSNTRPNEAHSQEVYSQYAPVADEIDLIDIWRILMEQKWLILGITALCTALAVGVALLLPREYKAEVIMMPPSIETVEKLNVPNIDESSEDYFFRVKPQELYHELIKNLQSHSLQRKFFDENGLVRVLASKEDVRPIELIFREEFSQKMVVGGVKQNKGEREFVNVTYTGKDPSQIADWLNSFVQLVDAETITAQQQSFSMKVKRRRESVSQRIDSLRSIEQARRLDLIARLEEASVIAEGIGWRERTGFSGGGSSNDNSNGVNMSLNLQSTPLYWRGVKALKSEITTLKQRANDDPFIPELRGLQEQLDFLSSVSQDIDNVHAMRLDQPAIADNRPVTPNRKLIVVLGFVLGGLLAVFVAFIRNMVVTAKNTSLD